MLALLLLKSVLSTQIKEELGDVWITPGETVNFDLYDYFEGEYLEFSISDGNSTEEETSLNNPFSIEQKAFIPGEKSGQKWKNRNLLTITQDSVSYFFNYNKNYVQLYSVDPSSDSFRLEWDKALPLDPNSTQIIQLSVLEQDNFEMLMLIVSQQPFRGKEVKNKVYFYLIEITRVKDPGQPQQLLLEGTDEIVLAKSPRKMGDYIALIGKRVDGSYALYIYSYSPPTSAGKLEVLDKYYSLPNASNLKMDLVDIDFYDNTIILLDKNIGLITYIFNGFLYYEHRFVYMTRFGVPYCLESYSVEWSNEYNLYNIATDKGLLSVAGEDLIETIWLYGINSSGCHCGVNSSILIENYYFLGIPNELSVVKVRSISEQIPVFNVNLKEKLGDNYDNYGLWTVVHGYLGVYYYIRTDLDGIRLFKLKLGDWILTVNGVQKDFYVQVLAKSPTGEVARSNLNVKIIEHNLEHIYLMNGYRMLNISELNCEVFFQGLKGNLEITPSEYFSGKDLNYTLSVEEVPSGLIDLKVTQINKTETILDSYFALALFSTCVVENVIFFSGSNQIYFLDYLGGHFKLSRYVSIGSPIDLFRVYGGLGVISRKGTHFYFSNFAFYDIQEQVLELDFYCTVYTTLDVYFVCAEPQKFNVYKADKNSGLYLLLKSISSESFNISKPFDILDMDLKQGEIPQKYYLFMLDSNLGVRIIDMDAITEANQEMHFLDNFLPYRKSKFIRCSSDKVYLIEDDGAIEIYQTDLGYINKIYTKASGQVTQVEVLANFVYVHIGDKLAIYDAVQPPHNSLFRMVELGANCTFQPSFVEGRGSRLVSLCQYFDISLVNIQKSICPVSPYNLPCSMKTNLEVSMKDPYKISQDEYKASLSLTATNSESELTLPVNLTIYTQGENIYVNNSTLSFYQNMTVDYYISTYMNLNEVVYGQNMNISMNINGKYPNFLENDKDPARLYPKVQEAQYYQGQSGDKFFDHTVLFDTNKVVVTTELEGILVLSISDNDLSNASQASLEATINVTQKLNRTNTVCRSIECVTTQSSKSLFLSSCSFDKEIEFNPQNFIIKKNILVLWEYNLYEKQVERIHELEVDFNPAWLKVVTSEVSEFMILSVDTHKNGDYVHHRNNHIIRIKGHWSLSDLNLEMVEVIDFHSLNLQAFYANTLDGVYTSSGEVYLYVADHWYGLRVLSSRKNESSIIVNSIAFKTKSILGVGVCGTNLFLTTKKAELLHYYLLNDHIPSLNQVYYSYNTQDNTYYGLTSHITCSYYYRPNYIAFSLRSSENEFTLRVVNTLSPKKSAVFADIPISPQFSVYSPASVEFYNDHTITSISMDEALFTSYVIRPSNVIIPSMNESQYQAMEKKWGSDTFEIFLEIQNENMQVKTPTISLKRSGSDSDDTKDPENQGGGDNSWWIWLLVGLGLFSISLVAWFVARYFWKKRKPFNSTEYPVFLSGSSQLEDEEGL